MHVAVLADTHLRSADLGRLPEPVVRAVARADVLVHAGDVVAPGALRAMGALAPVHAVLGNNDHELAGTLPEALVLELGGVEVAVVHDAGRREGRAARLRRRFPTAAVVVFGHSHVPVDEVGLDGQILFNPGSATQRRAQPRRTFGVLELDGGKVRRRAIVPV
ncbi:MAG: metallophosphoesterase family protein [Acidimicrobiales bacterium]